MDLEVSELWNYELADLGITGESLEYCKNLLRLSNSPQSHQGVYANIEVFLGIAEAPEKNGYGVRRAWQELKENGKPLLDEDVGLYLEGTGDFARELLSLAEREFLSLKNLDCLDSCEIEVSRIGYNVHKQLEPM